MGGSSLTWFDRDTLTGRLTYRMALYADIKVSKDGRSPYRFAGRLPQGSTGHPSDEWLSEPISAQCGLDGQ